jgi:hypothetical protein
MSRCFQVFNNKPIQKFTYASDVIYNKKSKTQYSCVCLNRPCCCKYGTYNNYNLYNNAQLLNAYVLPFSKTSMNSNLYIKLNLKDICTVQLNNPLTCPTTVNVYATVPFYYNYTIDPYGYLFGNNKYRNNPQCNINNYIKFRYYN